MKTWDDLEKEQAEFHGPELHKLITDVSDALGKGLFTTQEIEEENNMKRNELINRFANLFLGEDQDMYDYPLPMLDELVNTLEGLKENGMLDLETEEGFNRFVETHKEITAPYWDMFA